MTFAKTEPVFDRAAAAFKAYLDGDKTSLNTLVDLLNPHLWQVMRAAGLTETEANEVISATWLTFFEKCSTVQDPQAVMAWVLQTGRRKAWRVAKNTQREVAEITATEGSDSVRYINLADAESPEETVTNMDAYRRLWDHFNQLDSRCRVLLRHVAVGARPNYKELATSMGVAQGSVGPTRGRCLQKLRNSLEQDPHWSRP